jgi:hypothetical protein
VSTFTPPIIKDRPAYLPDSTPEQRDLWRHFENRYRGVNIWILASGKVITETATPENSNIDTSQVYPWDVNNAYAPYVRAIYIDVGVRPQIPSEHDTAHSDPPVAFFSGGSAHTVTAAQVAILTNPANCGSGTGYAGNIT